MLLNFLTKGYNTNITNIIIGLNEIHQYMLKLTSLLEQTTRARLTLSESSAQQLTSLLQNNNKNKLSIFETILQNLKGRSVLDKHFFKK